MIFVIQEQSITLNENLIWDYPLDLIFFKKNKLTFSQWQKILVGWSITNKVLVVSHSTSHLQYCLNSDHNWKSKNVGIFVVVSAIPTMRWQNILAFSLKYHMGTLIFQMTISTEPELTQGKGWATSQNSSSWAWPKTQICRNSYLLCAYWSIWSHWQVTCSSQSPSLSAQLWLLPCTSSCPTCPS